jgi:hypothetical protein
MCVSGAFLVRPSSRPDCLALSHRTLEGKKRKKINIVNLNKCLMLIIMILIWLGGGFFRVLFAHFFIYIFFVLFLSKTFSLYRF